MISPRELGNIIGAAIIPFLVICYIISKSWKRDKNKIKKKGDDKIFLKW